MKIETAQRTADGGLLLTGLDGTALPLDRDDVEKIQAALAQPAPADFRVGDWVETLDGEVLAQVVSIDVDGSCTVRLCYDGEGMDKRGFGRMSLMGFGVQELRLVQSFTVEWLRENLLDDWGGWGTRAYHGLVNNGITHVSELTALTVVRVLHWRNVGLQTLGFYLGILEDHGLSFAPCRRNYRRLLDPGDFCLDERVAWAGR